MKLKKKAADDVSTELFCLQAMAVVCYVNPTVHSRPTFLGTKRPHSETEDSETDEDETAVTSRHCQALLSG